MDKNSIKRTIESNDDGSNKKIKIDISGSKLVWNYTDNPNIVQAKTVDEHLLEDAAKNKNDVPCNTEFTIYSDDSRLKSCEEGNKNNSLTKSEQENDCVLYAQNLVEFTDLKDCDNNKTITPSSTASTSTLSEYTQISMMNSKTANKVNRNDISAATSTINSNDTINISTISGSATDEIELVLIPSSQELNITSFQKKNDNNNKKHLPTNINIIRQNAPTYSRITTVNANVGVQSTPALWNRVTLHSALRNQPIMVASKKLVPEVTQTTAKVSIGNTTISVPLLKPLNSTSLISPTISAESQKNAPTINTSHQQQNTINVNNFVNVKRGTKITHPTIVSLSQLQIKPVSTAKIVQAKVLNKKVPIIIPQTSMTAQSTVQPTPGIITITASKPKQNTVEDVLNNSLSPITITKAHSMSSTIEKKDANIETTVITDIVDIKANDFGNTTESRKSVPFKPLVNKEKTIE